MQKNGRHKFSLRLIALLAIVPTALPPILRAGTGATINEALVTQTLNVRLASGLPGAAAPFGNDAAADGTAAKPYATIKAALARAGTLKNGGTGVKILVAPGTYREGAPITNPTGGSFAVQYSAFNTAAPLVVEGAGWNSANPANTGDVIISGSEDWSGGWTNNGDGTWSKDWPYNWGVPALGSIPFGVSDAFLRRELVHVNGQTYYQINPPAPYTNQRSVNGQYGGFTEGGGAAPGDNLNGGRLTASEGSFWVTDAVRSADYATLVTPGKITIKLPANATSLDLAGTTNKVEVTTKWNMLQFFRSAAATGETNLVLRNLTFQHGGAEYCAVIQGQNNLLIEDCRFIKNKHIGLTITSSRNVTVRRSEFSENGEVGGSAEMTNGFYDRCLFLRNSRQGEILGYTGWSVGAIKFVSSTGKNVDITLYRCEARDNRSTGFWWDTGNSLCEMIECVSTGNSTNGTFIESNNSAANNTRGGGIPALGGNPTVTAIRSIFAKNRPVAGTESYRLDKGRGIFTSENENAVIDGCLIYDNEVQISPYDNTRAEMRNVTFRNSLIAAQNSNQRLYAVGSAGDSFPTIAVSSGGTVIATIKGSWFAFFDGMSGTTNDNRYFYPSATAFFNRSQRWGTSQWFTNNASRPGTPTLDLAAWRSAHLTNPNNLFADKSVDSRSTLTIGAYDETKPLVAITANVTTLAENAAAASAFTVTRVSALGYTAPLAVTYTLRANAGDATNGTDIETLSGTVTIPAGERSATITVTPKTDALVEAAEPLVLVLADPGTYVTAGNTTATLTLQDTTTPTTPGTAPTITTQPAAIAVTTGQSATFTVTATGTGPLTYQWLKNGDVIPGATTASYTTPATTTADNNSAYAVLVGNTSGSNLSASAALTVGAAGATVAPAISAQPRAASTTPGQSATFTVTASGTAPLAYQWFKNTTAIPGATAATYTLASTATADAGSYTVTVTNSAGTVTSQAASLTVLPSAIISNLSVRTTLAADQIVIVGLTLRGGPKPVLLRAVGPTLATFQVPDAMADPRLLLYRDSLLETTHDNWGGDPAVRTTMAALGSFPLPDTSRDAALVRTLEGNRTVHVQGPGPGTVLFEAYDAERGTASRLVNISARNLVGTGSAVLILGFTITGTGETTLLLRAAGPALGALGVPGALGDPKLELFDSAQKKIAENDDATAAARTTATAVGAFAFAPGSKDAGFLASLPPGNYTLVVSGVNNTAGDALAEVYEAP